MRMFYKICLVVLFAGFLFVLVPVDTALAGQCRINVTLNANPNPVPFNQDVTLSGTVTVSGLEPPGTVNAGFCVYSSTLLSGDIALRRMQVSITLENLPARNQIFPIFIDLTAGNSGPYSFSKTVKPSDFGVIRGGQNFTARASVCPAGGCSQKIFTSSGTLPVLVTAGVYGTFACIDSGGINRCSPGIKSDCSDVSACTAQQKQACRSISDTC